MTDDPSGERTADPGPISPELALVAPDRGREARARLPDRPWEAFAPPHRPPPPRLIVIRAGACPAPDEVPAGRRGRPRVGAMRAALAHAVFLALALAALTWAAERTPPPALLEPAPGDPVLGGAATAGLRDYLFAGGALTVSGEPAATARLALTSGCAAPGTTVWFDVSGPSFLFAGPLEGTGVAAVVRGAVISPEAIQLRVDLEGGRCGSVTVDSEARLSLAPLPSSGVEGSS